MRAAAAISASLALLALLAPACDGDETKEPALGEADAVYTVRGEIQRLPAKEGGKLFVHHEEIPDFVDQSGEEVGMKSMSMGFVPADALELSGLSPGAKVELTFEVRWSGDPRLRATQVEELPEDTELELTDL